MKSIVNHELGAKKDKFRGEIGYCVMWFSVALLIEGIAFSKGFDGVWSHTLAIISIIVSVTKMYLAFKKHKEFVN